MSSLVKLVQLLFVAVSLFHQKEADEAIAFLFFPLLGRYTVAFRLCVPYLVFRGDQYHFDVTQALVEFIMRLTSVIKNSAYSRCLIAILP